MYTITVLSVVAALSAITVAALYVSVRVKRRRRERSITTHPSVYTRLQTRGDRDDNSFRGLP